MGPFVLTRPSSATDNIIQPTANVPALVIDGFPGGTVALTDFRVHGVTPGSFVLTFKWASFDAGNNALWETSIYSDGSFLFEVPTTGTNIEDGAMIRPGTLDPTDATFKGRLDLLAFDFNSDLPAGGRVFLRGEADGTAPRIGFLGANAVVRQVGASAAAIAAIIDPNAKAAISALQTALANLGLVTSPA